MGGDGAEGEGGEPEAGVHDHEAHAHQVQRVQDKDQQVLALGVGVFISKCTSPYPRRFCKYRIHILLYVQEVVPRPKILNRTILSN